jgi:ATP-dependent exoDNAse (exonuclease V) beta subunit
MAWGTLVHALLEHAMRGPAPVRARAHLERLANWLTMDNPALRRVVPDALETVEGVMASEFWQRAQAAAERQVEVPLAVKLPAGDGAEAPRVLYGVIDLAFRTPAGWELVDYKTDQAPPEALALAYRAQLRGYARQWTGIVGEAVAGARVYAVCARQMTDDLLG